MSSHSGRVLSGDSVRLRSERRPSRKRWTPAAVTLVFVLVFGGCKRETPKNLSPARVHAITREMMRAAGHYSKRPGDVAAHLQFDGVHANRPDQLVVTLPAMTSEQARRDSLTRLVQALDTVATLNHLTRDAVSNSGALFRMDFRSAGGVTHSVHIVAPMLASSLLPREPKNSSQAGEARLAIILDDLGNDRAAAEEIFGLPYPLTVSVLPGHAHSLEIAQEAHRRGFEVMLHLPMQSIGNETPEAQELHPGMPADEISPLFEQMMESVPFAAGVNNHQGSQATADPALMQELMPVLLKWNLFYVDSRTTAATVAYDSAQRAGVRSAFRNVPFLDDVVELPAIRKQLELAMRDARKKGAAVAIGHPHPATLQALREVLPQAMAGGVRLVFVSDLVH